MAQVLPLRLSSQGHHGPLQPPHPCSLNPLPHFIPGLQDAVGKMQAECTDTTQLTANAIGTSQHLATISSWIESSRLELSPGKTTVMLGGRGKHFKELASSASRAPALRLLRLSIALGPLRVFSSAGTRNSHGSKHCPHPSLTGQKITSHPIGHSLAASMLTLQVPSLLFLRSRNDNLEELQLIQPMCLVTKVAMRNLIHQLLTNMELSFEVSVLIFQHPMRLAPSPWEIALPLQAGCPTTATCHRAM